MRHRLLVPPARRLTGLAPSGRALAPLLLAALLLAAGARAQGQSDPPQTPLPAPPPADTLAARPEAVPEGAPEAVSQAVPEAVTLEGPQIALTGVPFAVTVRGLDTTAAAGAAVRVGARLFPLEVGPEGALVAPAVVAPSRGTTVVEAVHDGAVIGRAETRTLPGWTSILPPLIAILVALAFRQVVPALFLGVWVGAVLAVGMTPGGVGKGLFDTLQVFILGALADEGHAAIILFSFMIGGMVGIIQKNGGTQGIVEHIVRWASTPKRGQLSAAVLASSSSSTTTPTPSSSGRRCGR